MRGMLDVCVECGLILELHYAAERVALSSRGNVWADVRLKKAGDLPLEGSDVFRGFLFLRFGCARLPLKCEDMKYGSGGACIAGQQGLGVRSKG